MRSWRTRMQPVAGLFDSICQKFGDRVVLDKTGKEIMLDGTILDAIRNPLNALVERVVTFDASAEIEDENGHKILLKAFQDAGQVNIVLSADGVFSPQRIFRKI